MSNQPISQNTSSTKLLGLMFLLGLILAVAFVEISLRVFNFKYNLYPEKIEFGWPNPKTLEDLYLPDNDLLWVPKDYNNKVAELIQQPPQILFLGDSCTEYGTYEKYFPEHFNRQYPHQKINVDKLGAGGWTSFQGLKAMQRDISRIKPKIATIYFGWNDHWIGFGIEDKAIAAIRSPLFSVLERFRTAQLLVKSYITLTNSHPGQHPLRVSAEDFKANLLSISETAKAHDIIPVLLTAPSSHRLGKEPQYLKKRHIKDLSQLVPLHQSYQQIVRDVSINNQVVLCDLAASFDKLPDQDLVNKYFNSDGIHLTKGPGEGYDLLAKFLFECLDQKALLKNTAL